MEAPGHRYLEPFVQKDLARKMVFLSGPRQVGKTTLAQALLGEAEERYFNWDFDPDRERILRGEWPAGPGLIVLDEIHKHRQWRNLVKGLFDKRRREVQILVTGSARLDLYRRGGDSLQGRYHFHQLHPLSVAELGLRTRKELDTLLALSGFPEPYYSGSQTEKKRWTLEYRTRLIREDLRDLERVTEVSTLERLALRLPELVGSPLSYNNLREDLGVAHATVVRWVDILERLYFVFRIYPFGAPRLRAVKKPPKHYHWDWSLTGTGLSSLSRGRAWRTSSRATSSSGATSSATRLAATSTSPTSATSTAARSISCCWRTASPSSSSSASRPVAQRRRACAT